MFPWIRKKKKVASDDSWAGYWAGYIPSDHVGRHYDSLVMDDDLIGTSYIAKGDPMFVFESAKSPFVTQEHLDIEDLGEGWYRTSIEPTKENQMENDVQKIYMIYGEGRDLPRRVHNNRLEAIHEAERLARKSPGTRFHVLCTMQSCIVDNPPVRWS